MCITHYKAGSITRHTSNGVTTIKQRRCFFQHIQYRRIVGIDFIFLYQKMVHHFHHGCQIALALKLTRIYIHQPKELIGIYKIEVAGECEVTGCIGIAFNKPQDNENDFQRWLPTDEEEDDDDDDMDLVQKLMKQKYEYKEKEPTLDEILDKINQKGVSSLSFQEQAILKNYN